MRGDLARARPQVIALGVDGDEEERFRVSGFGFRVHGFRGPGSGARGPGSGARGSGRGSRDNEARAWFVVPLPHVPLDVFVHSYLFLLETEEICVYEYGRSPGVVLIPFRALRAFRGWSLHDFVLHDFARVRVLE